MGSVGLDEAVAQFRVAVDALLDADRTRLSGPEFAAAMAEVETERRRLECVDQQLLADAVERGTAGEFGRTSPMDLLITLFRVSPREARARVARAGDLGPRRAPTGEPLAPILPAVAAAVRAGEISGEHATVIIRAVDKIPARYGREMGEIVENALVDQARHTHPGEVAKAGEVLLARIDQDGDEPREEERQRRRNFRLGRRADGTVVPCGSLNPLTGALWDAILDPLSKPIPDTESGEHDDRSAGQRRHDALHEAGLRLIRSGTLPDNGGVAVTLLAHLNADQLTAELAEHLGLDPAELGLSADDDATDDENDDDDDESVVLFDIDDTDDTGEDDADAADEFLFDVDDTDEPGDVDRPDDHSGKWDCHSTADDYACTRAQRRAMQRAERREQLRARRLVRWGAKRGGIAQTAHGDLLPITELLQMAAEAQIIPVVLDNAGGILSYGRTRRLASPGQRLALAARDRGCSFPGCTRPPAWCQAHHVIPWLDGGPTNLANLCLLCTYHHSQFEKLGWTVQMTNGVPEWIPPPWLDQDQIPRRNTAHHILDFAFDFNDTG